MTYRETSGKIWGYEIIRFDRQLPQIFEQYYYTKEYYIKNVALNKKISQAHS